MSRAYFKKGLLLYFLGNFSSKLISLLLLPLFTAYLSQEEYGLFDILNTVVLFLVPIAGAQIFEGILRYLIDANDENEKSKLVSSSFYFLIGSIVLVNVIIMIAQKITDIPYTNLLLLYFNFYIINFYLQRVARGLAMQSHYAISGIINTVVIAVTSMYLLVFLSFKTDGLLIAYAAGAVSSTVYLLIAINFPRLLSFTLFDKQLLKTLLVYSIPLLFDAIIWWTMNLSDRLILSYFKGNESVGLYSVANKFATLLTFLNHIFYLVWQEYAIINAKKEGKEKEFSEIFMQYIRVQFTGVILVMPIVKLFIDYFIDESFQSAYLFVPPLLFGAMFASFAAFYGLFYQIDKNTKGALFTSSIAGVLNIVLNVIMIPIYGIWAAAITTLLSFALLWVIRIAIFPSFLYKKNELLKHVLLGIVFTVIGLFAFYQEQLIVDVVNVILAGILFMYVNKTLLLKFLNKA